MNWADFVIGACAGSVLTIGGGAYASKRVIKWGMENPQKAMQFFMRKVH